MTLFLNYIFLSSVVFGFICLVYLSLKTIKLI